VLLWVFRSFDLGGLDDGSMAVSVSGFFVVRRESPCREQAVVASQAIGELHCGSADVPGASESSVCFVLVTD